MSADALAQTVFSDGGAAFAACFVLLVFSGLLRPLRRSIPTIASGPGPAKPPPDLTPDRVGTWPISLSSIELALIAELSLEQAREHETVASDASRRHESRQAASAAAAAWRERARILQLEAARRSGQPMLPGWPAAAMASTYTGPERRRHSRRSETRRGRPVAPTDAPGSPDRRTGPERRRHDRRRPQLASN